MQTTRFLERSGSIAERVTDFMSHLRGNGIPVGFVETDAAMRAFASINVVDVDAARMALKAICARNEDGFERFDELFTAFWLNRGREKSGTERRDEIRNNASQRSNLSQADDGTTDGSSGAQSEVDADRTGEASAGGEGKLVASRVSNLEKTDFREMMTPEALAQAEQVARLIARQFRDRRSRRRRAHSRGKLIDLRRVARAAVQTGGEPLSLFRLKKPDRPVTLVTLLDVSGSMTVYARVFLAFLKGLMSADQKTEAFLFHTKLVNIGEALRDHDTLRAINRLSMMAQGFGGGTKIAGNLASFNAQYARSMVNGRTVVIILSDGYDTDAPEEMASQMHRLKKRGCKVIWLNPLIGWKDYAPVAQGMAAALPFVDLFAAANTLESLKAVTPHLEAL
ncbi:VWA domain-containing protein [Anderseniella sp. Alg231-50]|uniref:VWA domain-containing protein n=1 Tax=Anderseniella sp. Alg231-50 TaxID=1922226 RepID=UPI000D55AA48